jgi:response regulator RpfG family c-di-GMP phosphodiesterase
MNLPEQNQFLIMLVDDTKEDLYINNRMINKYMANNNVLQFSMGTLAMEYLKANQENLDLIPHIIFLDIHMPQMTGFQFLEEFDNLPTPIKARTRIYMLSSTFDPDDIQNANRSPYVDHFFEKPLSKKAIEEIVMKNIELFGGDLG